MEVPDPEPASVDQQRGAPDYIVDMLLGVMRPYPGVDPCSRAGIAYARAARVEARVYADRIWEEAWHAGAAWGLARNTKIQVQVSAERLDQIDKETA